MFISHLANEVQLQYSWGDGTWPLGYVCHYRAKENFSPNNWESGISPYIFAFFYAPSPFRFNTQVKCFVLKRMLSLFLYCLSFAAIFLAYWEIKPTHSHLCAALTSKVCSHANLNWTTKKDRLGTKVCLVAISCFSENDCIYLSNKYLYAHIEKWMNNCKWNISTTM